ncbi:hypothetical protein ACFPTY_14865 [Halomonas beimenensis]|uniref:Uncharacterized protein n=1 Tax=Halomonas beimenensis TaxID=475662 RepID=A0A291PBP5_9GAMM|nr:hypothetical protein BEI_3315 [Halomonas beimenensis]
MHRPGRVPEPDSQRRDKTARVAIDADTDVHLHLQEHPHARLLR